MKPVWLIYRREMGAYLRSPLGYIVVAVVLLIDGLLFNAFALGSDTARKSSEVLKQFFYFSSGTTMVASLFLSMRLLAEERAQGTLNLLFGSPVRDYQIILGKYLSALTFLSGLTLLTIYMPALIAVHGKITFGQIAAGYLGLILLGSTGLSIGIFGSALTKSQLVAIISSAAILVGLILSWLMALITDRPINELFTWLSIHNKHFQPFMTGLINTQDVVFYASLSYFFLFLATRVLESRRWSD
ncbi:MAG TPA: ABC transporter permease [Pseudomonadota bacterium]|nr:ABC transporter permease [Pseudomonadota bacterium]